jgi:hypothetical protein
MPLLSIGFASVIEANKDAAHAGYLMPACPHFEQRVRTGSRNYGIVNASQNIYTAVIIVLDTNGFEY